MLKYFALIIALTSQLTYAQLNLSQSDSDLNWKEINSESFRVIYPDYLSERARYTSQLLEFYRPLVGESYQSTPKKLDLIIRPQMITPNGFVTLAPRRSEWFHNASITPSIGSLEWFQILAIHEYRHVVQFDHIRKGNVRWGYNLFGEGVLGFLMNIVLPAWYFEGDGVWAETVLSDGGRGRSPRFSARLKALITADQFPKYDDLLAGDYTTNLPNLYVYGYYLVTRAYNLYGPQTWKSITAFASDSPWNIYAFYRSFRIVTGVTFEDFYNDTLIELKEKWLAQTPELNKKTPSIKEYESTYFPMTDNHHLYYFKQTLDTQLSLFEDDQFIDEFGISPSASKIDLQNGMLIFVESLPHYRYIYKNYSDIFIYSIKTKEKKQITTNKRYSHPQFNHDNSKILAIEFNKQGNFTLNILNLNGKILQSIPAIKNQLITEAAWLNDHSVIAFSINNRGKKQILSINLDNNSVTELSPHTRNNFYNLKIKAETLFFEADYQGKVNIFRYNLTNKIYSQCTHEVIAAYSPHPAEELYYTAVSVNGTEIKKRDYNCEQISQTDLFEEDKYLTESSPSDFYHNSLPKKTPILFEATIEEQEQQEQNYPEYSNVFKPHSWSFIGGRGFQLEGTSSNMLGSLSALAYTGVSSEESGGFIGGGLSYAKYYPIFSILFDHAKRRQEITSDEFTSWNESIGKLEVSLPYLHRFGLYTGMHSLSLTTGLISASTNDYTSTTKLNDDKLQSKTINLQMSIAKSKTKREIIPRWSTRLNTSYTDIKSDNNPQKNYYAQVAAELTAPGFNVNHGWILDFNHEYRAKNETLYQLQSNYVPLQGYKFSRGYTYQFTPQFSKFALSYTLPVSYPKTGITDWIYFTRIYTKLFFDYTTYENRFDNMRTINSKGIELYFESNTLRKLPFTYGLRVLHNQRDNLGQMEIFLATIIN
ncbi:MAG: hypothetical protein HON90_08580 [Halobacteriovoraceae bacterium]|nr:hypothetical protein [Halobacteriovoraceae bacterium]